MSTEARDWWDRAQRALSTAERLVDEDPDASASRAYYAAFFAVRALFALQQRTFRRHTEVETAIHRDLVKGGSWPTDVGADFSWLASLRHTADYGGETHVASEEARQALRKARRILDSVRDTSAGAFPG